MLILRPLMRGCERSIRLRQFAGVDNQGLGGCIVEARISLLRNLSKRACDNAS